MWHTLTKRPDAPPKASNAEMRLHNRQHAKWQAASGGGGRRGGRHLCLASWISKMPHIMVAQTPDLHIFRLFPEIGVAFTRPRPGCSI